MKNCVVKKSVSINKYIITILYIMTTINTTELKSVKNYALSINKSVQWVYKLIERGDIKCIKIDGSKFIKIV